MIRRLSRKIFKFDKKNFLWYNYIMTDEVKKLKEIIDRSSDIVFFGGAGVSTESGIPDFRSANGLYSQKLNRNYSPEELVSHGFFVNHPEEFFQFYKSHLIYPQARPNSCHKALAELEKQGKVRAVVTQNIDGLHQAAGSKNVFELHGSVLRNFCQACGAFYDEKFVLQSEGIPLCPKCGGSVKPDVVLYGEGLNNQIVVGAIRAIEKCETLIIGGTSLIVYPAAGMINYFGGKNLVLINKTETTADAGADLIIRDNIAEVFSAIM